MRPTLTAAITAAVAGLTLLTACSAAPASGGDELSAGLTGEPIVIGSSSPATGQAYNSPERWEGLRAGVLAVNKAGGIDGRPLRLEFCDGRFDPNAEINCARQLVAKKVVAAINPDFQADASGTAYKILDDAGIPQVGNTGQAPATLTAPSSYLLSSGLPGWFYGAMAALVDNGSTRIAILVGNTPSAQFSAELMSKALDRAGLDAVTTVVFDPKADPTGATAAAKATADGVDGIGLAMATPAIPVAVSALRKGGYSGAIASAGAIITPAVVQTLGPDAEGIRLVSQTAFTTDTANPAVARYLDDLEAVGDGAQPKDLSLFAWSGVQLFAQLARGTDITDAASVTRALDELSTPIDIGTAPPWSIAGRTSPLPEYPRLLNPAIQIGIVKDGVVQPNGSGFVDPFALLAAAPAR